MEAFVMNKIDYIISNSKGEVIVESNNHLNNGIKTKENEGLLERLLLYCRRQNLLKNKGNHI